MFAFMYVALIVGAVILSLQIAGFAFLFGSGAGLLAGVVEFVSATFSGFAPGAPIGHLRIDPPAESESGPDPAYRSYYAGPVLVDHWKVLVRTFGLISGKILVGWRDEVTGVARKSHVEWVWAQVRRFDSAVWTAFAFAPAVSTIGGLLVGMIAAFTFVAVTSLLFTLLLGLLVLGTLVAAGVLRVVELLVLYVRGITIECGSCHVRAVRPIYRCGKCDAAHRKLVPGLEGVLNRTCRCETTLRTLVMFGKAKLTAQCAACKSQLPVKGLTAPTVHIPVIAGPQAGKSVFMQIALTRLMVHGQEDGGGFEFADENAKENFEKNVRIGVTNDPSRITKTAIVRPRAYNVFVGKEGSRSRRLLYLYDPAGESINNVDHLADAQFLKFTKGIVFVVDPFSLRAVRSASDRSLLNRVSASSTEAKAVLERFTEAMRERMPTGRSNRVDVPVAVVLTKADGLLDSSGATHPYARLGAAATDPTLRVERDGAVRGWLGDVGGRGDLVSSLDNHFSAVSYFVVSFQDAVDLSARELDDKTSEVTNDDPAAPLLWLLDRKARR